MLFDNCQSEIQRASQFGIDSRHHSACNPSGLPPSSWAAVWPPKWRPTPYGWVWATGPAERTWTSQWKTSKRLSRYWSRANKKPPWSHRQAWHTFKTYFIIFMQTMLNGSFFFFNHFNLHLHQIFTSQHPFIHLIQIMNTNESVQQQQNYIM